MAHFMYFLLNTEKQTQFGQYDLPRELKDIARSMTNFFLFSGKNLKKIAISDILKAITLEVSVITRQMTPFFSSIR